MCHLQLMQQAAPIFNSNPAGGVYLISSSAAVSVALMKEKKYTELQQGNQL